MSFTIMHNKNGTMVPIKMSIWDAFKGAPSPKPAKPQPVSDSQHSVKPESSHIPVLSEPVAPNAPTEELHVREDESSDLLTECSCCHKVHAPKKAPNQTAKDKGSGKANAGNSKEKDTDTHNFSTRVEETYSAADDEKIIAMKQKEEPWKAILAAIEKTSLSQLKEHWKSINPNAANGDDKDQDAKKKESENAKGDAQGKKNSNQEQEKGKKGAKKGTEIETAEGEMKSWSDRYNRQKWIAAASRHFDLTGQRITPAVAKKMASGK